MKLIAIQTIDHNEDGSMYILPECRHQAKRLKKMKKKQPPLLCLSFNRHQFAFQNGFRVQCIRHQRSIDQALISYTCNIWLSISRDVHLMRLHYVDVV